jgi:NOL1/NOP2/fmu family ribosome biogenesis protein
LLHQAVTIGCGKTRDGRCRAGFPKNKKMEQ